MQILNSVVNNAFTVCLSTYPYLYLHAHINVSYPSLSVYPHVCSPSVYLFICVYLFVASFGYLIIYGFLFIHRLFICSFIHLLFHLYDRRYRDLVV